MQQCCTEKDELQLCGDPWAGELGTETFAAFFRVDLVLFSPSLVPLK